MIILLKNLLILAFKIIYLILFQSHACKNKLVDQIHKSGQLFRLIFEDGHGNTKQKPLLDFSAFNINN